MPTYITLIHKDAGSAFGISFPDFPGCASHGTTLEDARRRGAEALAFHMDGMIEDNADIPAPSSLDIVMSDPGNRDGICVLIDTPPLDDRRAAGAMKLQLGCKPSRNKPRA